MPSIITDPDLADTVNDELAQRVRREAEGIKRCPSRAKVKAELGDKRAAIMGVFYKAQIVPDIARFTQLQPGTVCRLLLELEAAGKVRKTGEQRAANVDGLLYDVWDVVPPT